MDPHSSAPKKNTSHGNEVLLHDTTHLIQRPCYQQEQVRAKIQQAIGPHEDFLTIVKTQSAVVWSCFPFIRSGQNHLAMRSDRGKKTRQTGEEVGRQHQVMDKPGVSSPSPRGQWRTKEKWRKLIVKSSVVPKRPSRLRDWPKPSCKAQ